MARPLGLFCAFVAVAAFACRGDRQQSVTHCPLEPRTDGGFRVMRQGCLFGYVVDKASADKYFAGAWDLDDATLSAFESRLSKASFAVPNRYGRHYVGRTDESGQKIVQVDFFCDQEFDWHREVIGPSDGEPCVLRATYRVDSQEIFPLWYTGAGATDLRESPR